MFPDDLGARVAVVGRRAGHHLVQHRAEGVQVAPPVEVCLSERLLGTHVLHRAHGETGRCLRAPAPAPAPCRGAWIEQLGDPEVDEQGAARLGIEHDVVRLDVPVYQALRVGMPERLQHGFGDLERLVH